LRVSGGDYKSVQADTGHATTQMLLDRYAHVLEEEDRIKNARKVGDILFSEEVVKTASIDDQVTALLGNKELLARLLEKLQTEGGENESCTKSQKSCKTV
jgi:hypothetical protein